MTQSKGLQGVPPSAWATSSLQKTTEIQTYLVGGAVRDWLLGRHPKEYDMAFDADTATLLQRNPNARKVGKSVSVVLLEGKEYMPLAGTLEEDLLRRDLTINALALESNGILHGCPHALTDLVAGILRPVSARSFHEDPVRVFRAARMACELPDFTVHPTAVEQMREVARSGGLESIPKERVCREFIKALAAPKPSRWLAVLSEGEALVPWFAAFQNVCDPQSWKGSSPYLQDNNVESLHQLLEPLDSLVGDPLRVWMGLCALLARVGASTRACAREVAEAGLGVRAGAGASASVKQEAVVLSLEAESGLDQHEGLFSQAGHQNSTDASVSVAADFATAADLATAAAERLGLPVRYRDAGRLCALWYTRGVRYDSLSLEQRCTLLVRLHTTRLHPAFWQVVQSYSEQRWLEKAQADTACILAIRLPQTWRNRGEASGRALLSLRCQALASKAELS